MLSAGNNGKLWLLILSTIFLQIPSVWNGFACLSNPCLHGICLDDLNSTYFCYCIDGYTGVQCQTNWNECWSSPCQNGATCIDGIAMFNCSCSPGFVGDLCEENFNECDSNPCMNNGTCIDGTNGYTCLCQPGYSGIHCEIDVAVCNATNETRCANGGICIEGPGDTFGCKCQPGWGDFLCEAEIDECLSAPCQNGAICLDLHADYACACLFGYAGKNCEEVVEICEKNLCSNGALCLLESGHSVCYCVPDYHGNLCQFQYDECQLGQKCLNGGTCIDGVDTFTCSCPPNLTGVLCECLILDENNLDCTYISPKTTSTTTTKTTETITYEASQVPNISTLVTDVFETTTYYDTTWTESSTTELELTTMPFTTTEITDETTAWTSSIATTELETTITTTPEPSTTSETPTQYIDTTTMIATTQSETETTSESTIETTEITTEPIFETTFQTQEFTVTTDHILTSFYPITSTTEEYFETTTQNINATSSILSSTELFTYYTTEETTMIPLSSSSHEGREANFTEEMTLIPSITSFLTEEPSISTLQTDAFSMSTLETSSYHETTEISTTLLPLDCTLPEYHCQNGGTCIFTNGEYQCLCSFDAEGQLCEIHLGVRKAAFSGESYLSHRLLNLTQIQIEFNAKTLSSNGLLFYTNLDTAYMALYLENGYLKFKFSCGYQTMLLSELKIPVNNGNKINIKADLEFDKNWKHCDASVRVNDSLSMAGDQIAVLNAFNKPVAWLQFGNIPEEFLNNNLQVTGFVGCISDLKINNKKVNIFKDAESGFQITECSSLACLSNPCSNGATCSSKGDIWKCNCKNGYLGKMCEISVCSNNPCLFGGTCIPFSGSGYICLCPFGKHGHFCENDLKITRPYFSASIRGLSSYVAYPIPGGISRNMELKFRFIPSTMEQISILMFVGQKGYHNSYSDHMAVSFVKGYIMLTWNLGSGPRRIFTTEPIKKGATDYLVRLGHFGRRAWLFVENLGNVTGRSPGNLLQLDVVPIFYFGGHHTRNFSTLPHDLPLHTGFSGCIFDVQLVSGSVVIPLQGSRQTTGRAVGQCGTTECYEHSCQNNGACLHHASTFMCLCQDAWFGPLCTSKRNPCDSNYHLCESGSTCVPLMVGYECDCPLGKTGKFCEKDEEITDMSLRGQRSFLSLNVAQFLQKNRFNIEMEIRPLTDDGLVLFIGRNSVQFISLSLQSGVLELKISNENNKMSNNGALTLTSSRILTKGIWYKIQIGIFGKKVYLTVDNVINTNLLANSQQFNLLKENIFIGGLPDLSLLPLTAISTLPIAYKGCIRNFIINANHIPLTKSNLLDGRNVVDCDGTPCGKDACQNGGTCWLDSNMRPHCSCLQPFYGKQCEHIPDCNEIPCKNMGKCKNSKCLCKNGWDGIFCENQITVKLPQFSGKSYLIIKSNNEKKREINNSVIDIKRLYLNFTTIKENGMILWTKKKKNFFGIGLEQGFMKISYSLEKFNISFTDILSYQYIADGLWHSMEILFTPFLIKLDGQILSNQFKNDKIIYNSKTFTDGIFYIANLPTNNELWNETNGIFSQTFEGCIEGFATTFDKIITDFTQFEGVDVDVCNVF